MRKFMAAVAVVSACHWLYGADPSVSLYGTVGSYQRSETIKVGYDNGEEAIKAVQALGFEVVENYEKGKFLVIKPAQDALLEEVKLKEIVALAAHPSIRSLSPNENAQLVGPLPLSLFSKVPDALLAEELSPKQRKLYDKRKKAPETVRIEVVEFNALGLGIDGHRPLEIAIFGDKVRVPIHVVTQRDCRTLVGKNEGNESSVVLKLTGSDLLGTLNHNGRVYTIETLGRGLHTIVEDDHSKLPLKTRD